MTGQPTSRGSPKAVLTAAGTSAVRRLLLLLPGCAGAASALRVPRGDAHGWPWGHPQGLPQSLAGGMSTARRCPPHLEDVTSPVTAGQGFTNLRGTTTFYFHFIFPWLVSAVTPRSGCPPSLGGAFGWRVVSDGRRELLPSPPQQTAALSPPRCGSRGAGCSFAPFKQRFGNGL